MTSVNINFEIKVRHWKDKATNCWIYYSKKYEVSAYGKTKKQARTMFVEVISDILLHTKPKPVKKKK